MGRLDGKVAVVLGAAAKDNMGQVMARRFAAEGASLVVGGRQADTLAALAGELRGKHALCDITRKADVEALATEYMALFSEGKYDAIRLIFMSFESMSRQKPVVLQLLPLQKPETDASKKVANVEYDFSPEPAKLLAELLPVKECTKVMLDAPRAVAQGFYQFHGQQQRSVRSLPLRQLRGGGDRRPHRRWRQGF